MSKRNKVRYGYVKKCDLYGCHDACNDHHSACERIPVLILPIDEAELDCPSMEGRLQFGDMGEVAPWTDRKVSFDLTPVEYSMVIDHG